MNHERNRPEVAVFPPLRSRARHAGPRWDTYEPPKARVLAVARTLTSATRLRDVTRLLRPEDGIEVSYTVNPGSAFDAGLPEYLNGLGVTVLSWREARRRRFHLVVACAVHRSMYRRDTPLVVLPHGAGYNRIVTESTGDTSSPAGLSARELMRRGKVLPSCICVSHDEQIARLAVSCPEAVPYAVTVGDPCFDRIRDSLPRRDIYRERLGVVGGRRLVVVHSTWSRHSLLGRCPDLPERLLAELPADEYAVALVLHPNVWARHTTDGVLERLARAMDAGLLVIPPQEGWRAAVVAGDWVIGDHGSTTFYSAALDRVTLLAATGLDELDPASPTAAFARRAPALDPGGPLLEQLLGAVDRHVPGELDDVFALQLGARGEGAERTRRKLYSYLEHRGVRLPPEAGPPDPVPDPRPVPHTVSAVHDVVGSRPADGVVELRRWPVVPGRHEAGRGFYAAHDHGTDTRWRGYAGVLARTTVEPLLPPARWAAVRFTALPALNVAVAALGSRTALVALRDGTLLEASSARPWGGHHAPLDPVLLGAAVNVLLAEGCSAKEIAEGVTVRTGTRDVRVEFTTPR
ncbi:hypothetical protein ACIQVO_33865 [Streptomyces sp. NPDC101062]|uniref:hypothetical protein n=1 Tax=unclassified Streptomyces TaxID=2593676 RepID=UPI0038217F89